MAVRQTDSYERCRQVSPPGSHKLPPPGVAQASIFRGAARCGPLHSPPRVSPSLCRALSTAGRCEVPGVASRRPRLAPRIFVA